MTGSVRGAGSTTLLPMISQSSAVFAVDAPLVELDIRMTGSADGAVLFCDDLVPITGSSRPFNERELASCAASGIRFTRLLVARDAVALMVGRDAPVTCLSQQQIYALAGPQSVDVATWSEASTVIPKAGENLPPLQLTVIGPGSSSGTRQTLVDLAIAPLAKERDVTPGLRPDYVDQPAEQLIRNAMLSQPGALGIAGLATASAWGNTVKLLEADFGDGCEGPSAEAINTGRYPLARELYVYVNLDAVASSPAQQAFVDHLVSDEGLSIAGEVGGVALSPDETAAVQQHWRDARERGKADVA
jgi:phosphate transport system substrate-binding protein